MTLFHSFSFFSLQVINLQNPSKTTVRGPSLHWKQFFFKPELRFISFEKFVDFDEFFKHHYNREGGAGREANKLQQSCLG